jgi:hypothetical protein
VRASRALFSRAAFALLCANVYAANIRVTAINYILPNSGALVYVPRWAQFDISGNYNAPSNQDILYDQLVSGYHQLNSCAGPPGATPSQVCASGTQQCLSCSNTFKTITWGSSSVTRSVGPCSWSRDGNYAVCGVQDATSTLAGYGAPSGGVATADPGIGGDMHIVVYNKTFTAAWQIPDSGCATYCGGAAGGLTSSGTRVVPINGTRGGWFPGFNADGTKIGWVNIVCLTGIDSNCTQIVEGTEIEVATWSPGASFPSTAAVSNVVFLTPAGIGGVACTGSPSTGRCDPASTQYLYEFEHWHPTDPLRFVVAGATYIQNGNTYIVSLAGSGSSPALMPICPTNLANIYLCHWNEHVMWSPDGQHMALATTYPTGPVQGQLTASPVLSSTNYPPLQEIAFVDPNNSNAIGLIKLSYFNSPGSADFDGDPQCHRRFDAVEFSPDNRYILLAMEETTAAGALCTGGHGTLGYAFVLLTLQPLLEIDAGSSLSNGAYAQ